MESVVPNYWRKADGSSRADGRVGKRLYHVIDAAYCQAFPASTPLNVSKKKRAC